MAEAERIIGTPDSPEGPSPASEPSGAYAAPWLSAAPRPAGLPPAGRDKAETADKADGADAVDGADAADGVGRPDQAATAGAAAWEAPSTAATEDPVAPEAEASPPLQEAAEDGPQPEPAAPTRARAVAQRKIAVLFAVAAFAYVFDLVSKVIVVARLEHHEAVDLIGDWLRLDAIRNAGAAFGMGQAYTVIFTVIATSVIVVIVRLARKLYSLPWAVALGLLLGGALGNLTDRLFRSPGVFEGAVVDFIAPKHFAVFNLADSAIVCGGILIVLLSFRGLDPDGTVHKE